MPGSYGRLPSPCDPAPFTESCLPGSSALPASALPACAPLLPTPCGPVPPAVACMPAGTTRLDSAQNTEGGGRLQGRLQAGRRCGGGARVASWLMHSYGGPLLIQHGRVVSPWKPFPGVQRGAGRMQVWEGGCGWLACPASSHALLGRPASSRLGMTEEGARGAVYPHMQLDCMQSNQAAQLWQLHRTSWNVMLHTTSGSTRLKK